MAPQPTRFAIIQRVWGMIWFSICLHWETLIQAVRRDGLTALIRPGPIREEASAKLLSVNANGFIAYENTTIVPSLVRTASGIVLELGPGPGNQIHRFNPNTVDQIYGIEPNPYYKGNIEAKLEQQGLQDRYKLITCGIEDSDILRREGISEESLDCVLSIQVLCAVDDPKSVMKEVWKLLKPGGNFIFWEHGCSRDQVSSATQACLEPLWSTFVGCHLTRSVLSDIVNSGEWENPHEIEEPYEPLSLLPRVQGVLIKKKI